MKKLLIFFPIVFLFAGCTSFRFWNYPDDFNIKYQSKSYLTGFEQNIDITQNELKLSFKKPNIEKKFSSINIHDDAKLEDIYDFVKSVEYLNQPQIAGEHLTDAPEESITVTYDNSSKTIIFGNIKTQPEYIIKLKSMIFDLTNSYYPDWKKEAEIE
jgi:hypothetical protein